MMLVEMPRKPINDSVSEAVLRVGSARPPRDNVAQCQITLDAGRFSAPRTAKHEADVHSVESAME